MVVSELLFSFMKARLFRAMMGPCMALGWYVLKGDLSNRWPFVGGDCLLIADAAAGCAVAALLATDPLRRSVVGRNEHANGATSSRRPRDDRRTLGEVMFGVVAPCATAFCLAALVYSQADLRPLGRTVYWTLLGTRAVLLSSVACVGSLVVSRVAALAPRALVEQFERHRVAAQFGDDSGATVNCVRLWSWATRLSGVGVVAWTTSTWYGALKQSDQLALPVLAAAFLVMCGPPALVMWSPADRNNQPRSIDDVSWMHGSLLLAYNMLLVAPLLPGAATALDPWFGVVSPIATTAYAALKLSSDQDDDEDDNYDDCYADDEAAWLLKPPVAQAVSSFLVPAAATWFSVAYLFCGVGVGGGAGGISLTMSGLSWIAWSHCLQLVIIAGTSIYFYKINENT